MKYLGLKRIPEGVVAMMDGESGIACWNEASISIAISNRATYRMGVPTALYDAARELAGPGAEGVMWYDESAAE